jgi:phosphatidylinositol glycan class N
MLSSTVIGLDSIGHSKRPYSENYIKNIIEVDKGVERISKIIDGFFGDNRTAFIFASDHGMSDKGILPTILPQRSFDFG